MPPATPERPAAPDKTHRLRPEGGADEARPAELPPATTGEPDDTRPVGRDWLSGAAQERATPPPAPTGGAPAAAGPGGDGTAGPPADEATARSDADEATTRSDADDATERFTTDDATERFTTADTTGQATQAQPAASGAAEHPATGATETSGSRTSGSRASGSQASGSETSGSGTSGSETSGSEASGSETSGSEKSGSEAPGTDGRDAPPTDGPTGPGDSTVPPTGGRTRRAGSGPGWRRPAVLAPVGVLALLALLYGGDLLVSSGEVPRGTVVAGVEVGGLEPAAARALLEEDLAPRVVADRTVVADDVQATFSPAAAGIELDVPATVDVAGDQPLNPWTRVVTLFGERTVDPVLTGDGTALAAQLEDVAAQVDRAPVDATIAGEGTALEVVEPVDGRSLDLWGAEEAVTAALREGRDPAIPIELPVDVEPVDVDAEEARRVLDEVVTPALSAPVTVVSEDGGTSAEIPETAIAASLAFAPQEDGELAVAIDTAALQEALGDELSRFGTPAEDARFEVSGGQVSIVPSVDGTGIDPAQLAEQLLPVLTEPAPREVTATLGPVPADLTTQEAEALGIREEISSFTTNIGNPNSGENIRVVAAEVDGHVVLPGETFSLNDFTGPRGVAQGYVEAGVINNGEFTTAVGGGISQFATTMFNAVFFAGLEDVVHKPHSYYISRYPAGREATVYYDSIDLEWRNDSDTGVFVDTAWTPGTITVTFYGTKRYDIESVSSERYNVRQPAVREKLQDGSCRPQSGSTGFDITVTRIFRELGTGTELRRERFQTRYAAEPAIRCVEPPPADPAAPGGAPPPAGG